MPGKSEVCFNAGNYTLAPVTVTVLHSGFKQWEGQTSLVQEWESAQQSRSYVPARSATEAWVCSGGILCISKPRHSVAFVGRAMKVLL